MDILCLILFGIFIGVMVGIITSLIGASGVVLSVPLLTLLFSVDIQTAIGTSLLVDVIASSIVSVSYYRAGNTDLKNGIWIAIGSVIGAQIGANVAGSMPESGLNNIFCYFMLAMGIIMLIKKEKPKAENTNFTEENTDFTKSQSMAISDKRKDKPLFEEQWKMILSCFAIGLGIGGLSGVIGAGGGLLILAVLVAVLAYPLHLAIGTSTLIMAITATSATIGCALQGNVSFMLGIILGIGSIIGGSLGSKYASKVSEAKLKKLMGVIFLLLGIAMLIIGTAT